jgi:hypothetical protein
MENFKMMKKDVVLFGGRAGVPEVERLLNYGMVKLARCGCTITMGEMFMYGLLRIQTTYGES